MEFSDLNYHWFNRPDFDEVVASMSLTDSDLEKVLTFRENGYLVIDTEIKEDIFHRVIQDTAVQYKGAEHETKRALNAWRHNKDIRSISTNTEIQCLLSLLYQRTPIPFQSINFNVGSEKLPHSDAIHFNTFPEGFLCAVWVALEDIHENNGPIVLYPGSHKLPYATILDVGKKAYQAKQVYDFYADYESYVEVLLQKTNLHPVTITLKKGQALIWSANMLHAGARIKDKEATRYSQVTHYYFDNCVYYGPLFSDVPLGKIHYWELTDINTGKPVIHKYMKDPVDIYPSKWQQLWNVLKSSKPDNFIY